MNQNLKKFLIFLPVLDKKNIMDRIWDTLTRKGSRGGLWIPVIRAALIAINTLEPPLMRNLHLGAFKQLLTAHMT
jgi:hypothetical protein